MYVSETVASWVINKSAEELRTENFKSCLMNKGKLSNIKINLGQVDESSQQNRDRTRSKNLLTR